MDTTIEVTGLRKRLGRTLALDGMTFTVAPGQVTGFVGPNGAGKSTTMRVILGLDAAEAGTALVGGRRYASLAHPLRHVGSLLDAGPRRRRAARQGFHGIPAVAAADPLRRHDHRLGRGQRRALQRLAWLPAFAAVVAVLWRAFR
jgi:ABC-2 type transport system ATP-binding protein